MYHVNTKKREKVIFSFFLGTMNERVSLLKYFNSFFKFPSFNFALFASRKNQSSYGIKFSLAFQLRTLHSREETHCTLNLFRTLESFALKLRIIFEGLKISYLWGFCDLCQRFCDILAKKKLAIQFENELCCRSVQQYYRKDQNYSIFVDNFFRIINVSPDFKVPLQYFFIDVQWISLCRSE